MDGRLEGNVVHFFGGSRRALGWRVGLSRGHGLVGEGLNLVKNREDGNVGNFAKKGGVGLVDVVAGRVAGPRNIQQTQNLVPEDERGAVQGPHGHQNGRAVGGKSLLVKEQVLENLIVLGVFVEGCLGGNVGHGHAWRRVGLVDEHADSVQAKFNARDSVASPKHLGLILALDNDFGKDEPQVCRHHHTNAFQKFV